MRQNWQHIWIMFIFIVMFDEVQVSNPRKASARSRPPRKRYTIIMFYFSLTFPKQKSLLPIRRLLEVIFGGRQGAVATFEMRRYLYKYVLQVSEGCML